MNFSFTLNPFSAKSLLKYTIKPYMKCTNLPTSIPLLTESQERTKHICLFVNLNIFSSGDKLVFCYRHGTNAAALLFSANSTLEELKSSKLKLQKCFCFCAFPNLDIKLFTGCSYKNKSK